MSADGVNLYKLQATKLPKEYNFQIVNTATSDNAFPTTPFPSVPSGKVLIITGFSLEYEIAAVGGIGVQNNNSGAYYFVSLPYTVNDIYKFEAWNLGTPWVIREGEAIDIVRQGGSGLTYVAANFVGFYADKSIIE